ncbi:hypothetical protein Q8W41_19320 [Vibrio splendidus]|uniref:hypothetical protein n=1 Tax=Vibrio splendidus TaxID=29497 RepID=UPI0027345AAA|nr:hypothetical protein [Vibrio splendidus]MDP2591648.1 hypothetical protein [Vibrio splendidus]
MVTDVMTSIKAYLYERAVSPLLGSLIVSWCFWNYRFLFLAVSDLKYADKMVEIDSFYQLEGSHNLLWLVDWTVSNFWALGVVFPFVTAMLYLFAFPFPAKWIYQFSLERQEELVSIKNRIEDNKQLTVEKSKAIMQQLAEVEKESDALIERKDRVIEAKDREIAELEAALEQIKEKEAQPFQPSTMAQAVVGEVMGETKPKVLSLEHEVEQLVKLGQVKIPKTESDFLAYILLTIYDNGGALSKGSLLNPFKDKTKVQYYLDEMVNRHFITYRANPSQEYSLIHNVKGFIVKYK